MRRISGIKVSPRSVTRTTDVRQRILMSASWAFNDPTLRHCLPWLRPHSSTPCTSTTFRPGSFYRIFMSMTQLRFISLLRHEPNTSILYVFKQMRNLHKIFKIKTIFCYCALKTRQVDSLVQRPQPETKKTIKNENKMSIGNRI